MIILIKIYKLYNSSNLSSGKWEELGKTEIIPENLDPKFMKSFIVPYNFEREQLVSINFFPIFFIHSVRASPTLSINLN